MKKASAFTDAFSVLQETAAHSLCNKNIPRAAFLKSLIGQAECLIPLRFVNDFFGD